MSEARATLDEFLALFNAGTDVDAIVALFAPDAQFWGTTMTEFGTDRSVIRNYFASAFARRNGATVTARITDSATAALSADAVTVLGRWEIERGDNVNRLRFSVVLKRQDGRWLIVQFHSSPRPAT
jgi:uncharacterized protein (TIGR02246 family)